MANFLESVLADAKRAKDRQFGGGQKKWVRRGHVRQNKHTESSAQQESRREMLKRKTVADAEYLYAKRRKKYNKVGQDHDQETSNIMDTIIAKLSIMEVRVRLRKMKQPILLFGEIEADTRKRLRQLEIISNEKVKGQPSGQRDEWREILEKEVNKELTDALLKSGQTDDEYQKHLLKKEAKDKKYDRARTRDEFKQTENYILFYFKRMLRVWENHLNERPTEEQHSHAGKQETTLQKQTRHNIKPFFKMLKKQTTPKDVLLLVEKIVDALNDRNYMEASRIYMDMAIGRAPWPMGVTSVGIHERGASETIRENKVAHILNNERQRKFIHSMKRLMRFAQLKYPNEDLTKMVDYAKNAGTYLTMDISNC